MRNTPELIIVSAYLVINSKTKAEQNTTDEKTSNNRTDCTCSTITSYYELISRMCNSLHWPTAVKNTSNQFYIFHKHLEIINIYFLTHFKKTWSPSLGVNSSHKKRRGSDKWFGTETTNVAQHLTMIYFFLWMWILFLYPISYYYKTIYSCVNFIRHEMYDVCLIGWAWTNSDLLAVMTNCDDKIVLENLNCVNYALVKKNQNTQVLALEMGHVQN